MGRRAGTRCPSRSCQVTSQPLERRRPGPGPGRHARPRARTRPQRPRTRPCPPGARGDHLGTLVLSALGLGNSQRAPRQSRACASLPTGMAVPGDSHLQVCRELLLLHQPGGRRDVAGTGEGGLAQLGRLFLRFLSHCKSPGCPSVPPPVLKRVPSCGFMPCATHGGKLEGDAGQDQALLTSLPWWGGEGAMTLLCSWARSVSSLCKSLVAGPVI